MASENQALTRSYRSGPANLSKTARQVVPQFLQKLYEMVNDPNNNDLIRWSESGDSFFVLDHERFAREVLGRWFKHQNFASFVRQLNMYGFHKIPHLQQGVLRSETETELWNFEHPHFHRAQPDLLCLIQRKKQAAPGDDNTDSAPASAAHQANNAQLLDVNSIVNGIAAIKRHQQTISADLNELKSSNQHLWQEAIAARERHKAHQDTINRILKFLASVFGRAGAHDAKDHEHHSPSPPLVTRRGQRLLIGDGREGRPKGVEVVEVDDEDNESVAETIRSDNGRTSAVDHEHSIADTAVEPYARIETPSIASPSVAHPSPAPSAVSRPPSVAPPSSSYFPDRPNTNANSAVELHRPPSNAPTQLLSPASTSSDAVLQAALQQLMHSPGQMQRFMQALSGTSPAAHNQAAGAVQPQSASIEAPAPLSSIPSFLQYMPGPSTPSQPQQPPSQVAIYTPPPDIPNNPNPSPTSFLNSSSMIDFPPLLTTSSDEDDALAAGVALQEARLHQTFANTNEIDAALDGVHESIDSIVRKLGLDSSALSQEADAGAYNMSGAQTPEFDFDALLHEFTSPDHDAGGGGGGFDTNGTVQFLDDAVHTLPQKRTSDVAELGLEGRTKKSKK